MGSRILGEYKNGTTPSILYQKGDEGGWYLEEESGENPNLSKSSSAGFFYTWPNEEGINNYQIGKTTIRFMYLVMYFGPLGPNFLKNENCHFSRKGLYDFFILSITIEDINT